MKLEKQLSFLPKLQKPKCEHGGSLAVGKRRSRRVLKIKQSHHLTLKSHHALGVRSLFRHKKMILGIIRKFSNRFNVKIYEISINGNHLHLLVKAHSREGLQNFFRVIAGHTAQQILKEYPLPPKSGGGARGIKQEFSKTSQDLAARGSLGCQKNQRKFWSYLLYSRIVTWGREFQRVSKYIQKNVLETLQLIAYEPRLVLKKKKGAILRC